MLFCLLYYIYGLVFVRFGKLRPRIIKIYCLNFRVNNKIVYFLLINLKSNDNILLFDCPLF